MASDFRPSFLDFLGGGAFISAFITFRRVPVSKWTLRNLWIPFRSWISRSIHFFFSYAIIRWHQTSVNNNYDILSWCFSFITLPIPSECLIFLRAHRRRKKARVESVDDVHRTIPTATWTACLILNRPTISGGRNSEFYCSYFFHILGIPC